MPKDKVPVHAIHPVTLRILKSFDSIYEAGRMLKVVPGAITQALKKRCIVKGYKWIFQTETMPEVRCEMMKKKYKK